MCPTPPDPAKPCATGVKDPACTVKYGKISLRGVVEGPTYKNVSFIVDGVAWPAIEHRFSIVYVTAGLTDKSMNFVVDVLEWPANEKCFFHHRWGSRAR